jgi:hypothetical protein
MMSGKLICGEIKTSLEKCEKFQGLPGYKMSTKNINDRMGE